MTENNDSERQLTVADLIEHLQKFDLGLPVWITTSDDAERCYEKMTLSDIEKGEIWHPEIDTEGDGPAESVNPLNHLGRQWNL